MDGITELATLFKERENILYQGPQIGTVISPPPNIKVSIGSSIILKNKNIIIANHILNGYTREFEASGNIENSGMTGNMKIDGLTKSFSDGNASGSTNIEGNITFTDTLKQGDEVILIPSTDDQTYFLIDKAVRL